MHRQRSDDELISGDNSRSLASLGLRASPLCTNIPDMDRLERERARLEDSRQRFAKSVRVSENAKRWLESEKPRPTRPPRAARQGSQNRLSQLAQPKARNSASVTDSCEKPEQKLSQTVGQVSRIEWQKPIVSKPHSRAVSPKHSRPLSGRSQSPSRCGHSFPSAPSSSYAPSVCNDIEILERKFARAAEQQWEMLNAQCHIPSILRPTEAEQELLDTFEAMAIDSPVSLPMSPSVAPSSAPSSPVSACLKSGSRFSKAILRSHENTSSEISSHKELVLHNTLWERIRTDELSTASPSIDDNGTSSRGTSATHQAAPLEIIQQTSLGEDKQIGETSLKTVVNLSRPRTPINSKDATNALISSSCSRTLTTTVPPQRGIQRKPAIMASVPTTSQQSQSTSLVGAVPANQNANQEQSASKDTSSASKGSSLVTTPQAAVVLTSVPSCGPLAMGLQRSHSSCGTKPTAQHDTPMSKTPCPSPLRATTPQPPMQHHSHTTATKATPQPPQPHMNTHNHLQATPQPPQSSHHTLHNQHAQPTPQPQAVATRITPQLPQQHQQFTSITPQPPKHAAATKAAPQLPKHTVLHSMSCGSVVPSMLQANLPGPEHV